MSQDIDLQKIRSICETDAPPGAFYEQLRKNNVSLCDSPLPILEPVLRAFYISAFQALPYEEMIHLLGQVSLCIDLGTIPIRFHFQTTVAVSGLPRWPRAYAFAITKLIENPKTLDSLISLNPQVDFSSISLGVLPEVKAISNLINQSIPLVSGGQPSKFSFRIGLSGKPIEIESDSTTDDGALTLGSKRQLEAPIASIGEDGLQRQTLCKRTRRTSELAALQTKVETMSHELQQLQNKFKRREDGEVGKKATQKRSSILGLL